MKTCNTCSVSKPKTEFYNRQAKCIPCAKAHALDYYYANKDHVLEVMKRPAARSAQKLRDLVRSKHPSRIAHARESSARYRKDNQEKRKVICARWNSKPHAKVLNALRAAKRRAMKLDATPRWARLDYIAFVYSEASRRDMHVDHVVPLVSPWVCGLHAETNLQLLTKHENHRKNNTWWPDMPTNLLKEMRYERTNQ